jgi:pyruvate formate lyase activating enzyme
MKIGGFQKISLLDYPNRISAIIWTMGCNLRCPFCYNKDLVFEKLNIIDEKEIIDYLEVRKDKLEAISISGGEPLLYDEIDTFIKKIKKLGYLVKIDTNGTYPDKLKNLIDKNLVDYVSMDVKAPKNKYNNLCGIKIDFSNIEKSIEIIKRISPDYEFKTTFVPDLLVKEDIINIAKMLKGSKLFYLQQLKNDSSMLSKKMNEVKPYSTDYLNETLNDIKPYFKNCYLRGV